MMARKHFWQKGDDCLLATSKLALHGESGIFNSLAALAIGDALGLSVEKMLLTLTNFKGLPHRFALVGESQGVSWFNDSKGTNIGATISSLRGLKDNTILLAGGVFKGGDLSLLRDAVREHAKHVILFGQDANLLKQALHGSIHVHIAGSMRDAVTIARDLSASGDKVLLSPACASFDMYENYIARGEDFESCVEELCVMKPSKQAARQFSTNVSIKLAKHCDVALMMSAMLLLGIGLVMVASSSIEIADRATGDPLYYFKRQFIFALMGIFMGIVFTKVRLAHWENSGMTLLFFMIGMLVLVLMPGLGKDCEWKYKVVVIRAIWPTSLRSR